MAIKIKNDSVKTDDIFTADETDIKETEPKSKIETDDFALFMDLVCKRRQPGISKVYMDFGHSIETGMKDDIEK